MIITSILFCFLLIFHRNLKLFKSSEYDYYNDINVTFLFRSIYLYSIYYCSNFFGIIAFSVNDKLICDAYKPVRSTHITRDICLLFLSSTLAKAITVYFDLILGPKCYMIESIKTQKGV